MSMGHMAQCVMTPGIIRMLLWSADSLGSPLMVSYEIYMMISDHKNLVSNNHVRTTTMAQCLMTSGIFLMFKNE